MYYQLFQLLSDNIYGLDAVLTADQNLTLTIMATVGCLFLVCLPFAVVWRVIKFICG